MLLNIVIVIILLVCPKLFNEGLPSRYRCMGQATAVYVLQVNNRGHVYQE